MAKAPSNYVRVVPMSEHLPMHASLQLFRVLVDRLGFEVVVERTPDYVAYTLREKKGKRSGC